MNIKVTRKTQTICNQYRMKPETMAFTDLVAIGWEPEDAWAVAMRIGVTWKKSALQEEIKGVLAQQQCIERIAATKSVLRKNQIEKIENAQKKDIEGVLERATSKEQMLIDLQTTLESTPAGSKEWLDIKKLIVEVSRMKQDTIKNDDTTIHYVLPVNYPTSCDNCLLDKCATCKFKYERKQGK